MKCAKNALAQSLNNLNGFVLFLDNPPAQETDKFKNAVAGRNDVAWFGLENATYTYDKLQMQDFENAQCFSCRGATILARPRRECRQMV